MKPTKMSKKQQQSSDAVVVTRSNWRWASLEASKQLVRYLKSGFRTKAQIAEKMSCSFVSANKRLVALSTSWNFSFKQVRQGDRGPTATAYKIIGKAVAAKRARRR